MNAVHAHISIIQYITHTHLQEDTQYSVIEFELPPPHITIQIYNDH